MIARRGTLKTWHWAHAEANPYCRTAGETEWHLSWKAEGLPGSQEQHVGNRWADVLAPGGYSVEFQRSPIDPPEMHRREDDWADQGGMIWVFYAIEAAQDRITGRLPWRWISVLGAQVYEIIWSHAPDRVRSARAPSFLDLGNDRLLFVGGWRPGSSPLTGYGWRVTRRWVIDNVLRGDEIPKPFGQDPEEVIRRRQHEEAERRRAEQARRAAERAAAIERAEARKRIEADLDLVWREANQGLELLAFTRRYSAGTEVIKEFVESWFTWPTWLVGAPRGRSDCHAGE